MRTGLLLACATAAVACQSGGPSRPAESPSALRWAEFLGRACVAISSCAHPHDTSRESDPGACVDDWLGKGPNDAAVLAACVAATRGCAGVNACVRSRGDAEAIAFCSANHGLRAACSGDQLVTCSEDDPEESTSIDCATLSATCGESRPPGGLLTYACLAPSVCAPSVIESRCAGRGAVLSCREGAVERVECAAGANCVERQSSDGSREAVCETAAHRRCDAVSASWCEGTSLVQCQPQGVLSKAITSDCAAFGMVCDDHAASGPGCVVPGARACEARGPKCEGEALTFCAAGERLRVSCREEGFGGCDPDAHGVEAACTRTKSDSAAHEASRGSW